MIKLTGNSSVSIQNAVANDLESLAQLYEELVGKQTDRAAMRENFASMQSDPNYVVLTAKVHNSLVGSIMGIICLDLAGNCNPFMVIENVIVSTTYRGKGIGARLMEAIEEIGRNRRCYYTMFVSRSDRREAHKFYELMGYDLDLVRGFKKYL